MAARVLQLIETAHARMGVSVRSVCISRESAEPSDKPFEAVEALVGGLLVYIRAVETEDWHQDALLEYIQTRLGVSFNLAVQLYELWCGKEMIEHYVADGN